jgi:hypothetical protein
MSTYVYGIIRASHSPLRQDLDGIGDPPRRVRVLRQGELGCRADRCRHGIRRRHPATLQVEPSCLPAWRCCP